MALEFDSATMQAALLGYQQQLKQIEEKMTELKRRLGGKAPGPRPVASVRNTPRKHRMSVEGRARIAAAQRARWAKTKRSKKHEAE